MDKWISVKERLPEDDKQFCVFAKWYPSWNCFVNSEAMYWIDIKNFRDYDLKNNYTHWIGLPKLRIPIKRKHTNNK